MLYLKCTRAVQKYLELKPESILSASKEESLLGNWYVNMFTADRRKTIVFMSERTLLSFILFGLKKSNCSNLPGLFLAGLEQLLNLEEVPSDQIARVIEEYSTFAFARTDSRVTLGNMNDLVFGYKVNISYEGGFSRCDVGKLIQMTNRTPQRNLGWRQSIEVTRQILGDV